MTYQYKSYQYLPSHKGDGRSWEARYEVIKNICNSIFQMTFQIDRDTEISLLLKLKVWGGGGGNVPEILGHEDVLTKYKIYKMVN